MLPQLWRGCRDRAPSVGDDGHRGEVGLDQLVAHPAEDVFVEEVLVVVAALGEGAPADLAVEEEALTARGHHLGGLVGLLVGEGGGEENGKRKLINSFQLPRL